MIDIIKITFKVEKAEFKAVINRHLNLNTINFNKMFFWKVLYKILK